MFFNSAYQGDVCSHTHSFVLDNGIRRIFQDPVKIAGPYIRPADTVIDFGCGPGFFTTAMAQLTGAEGKVWAVDLQPEMLEKMPVVTRVWRIPVHGQAPLRVNHSVLCGSEGRA